MLGQYEPFGQTILNMTTHTHTPHTQHTHTQILNNVAEEIQNNLMHLCCRIVVRAEMSLGAGCLVEHTCRIAVEAWITTNWIHHALFWTVSPCRANGLERNIMKQVQSNVHFNWKVK